MSRQKALIITEKPSVAKDVTAALGGFRAQNAGAYWESDDFLCTFAVGHIFELFGPEDIDPALKSWRIETLPIIPRTFQLKPVKGHEKRIAILGDLLKRRDVDHLINACDAAREGELIFREIVRYFGAAKPVRRLWLQSMTPEAIRKGFDTLRNGSELDGLAAAAECRSQSDWLIGMNATRAFSVRLRSASAREAAPWSVGRVQTPTLALLVRRELQILAHVPRPFFRLKARFEAPDHEYDGVWFDPKFKKPADDSSDLRDDRIFDQAKAQQIAAEVKHAIARASETREESKRLAPWLFNLTGLQKYMAARYKWSSRRTLDAAQRCYEQHKVLTYPRTSSSCLPSDYPLEVDKLIAGLADDPVYGPHARYLQISGRQNDKRVFDDKGVSDHFAIIPTGKQRDLGGDDGKVFDAVVRRFLATFFPPAVFDRVKRITEAAGHSFRTGPVETLMTPGWMAVYDRKAEPADDEKDPEAPSQQKLPPLKKGQKAAKNVPALILSTAIESDETRPLPRIGEAQLLGLMEHAGRQVENEDFAAALMSAEGLGTAATRADIIQNLKAKLYVDDTLRATSKGIQLITVLDRLGVARLTSPELTGRLELELSEVERGVRPQVRFMDEISQYTTDIVQAARTLDLARLYPDHNPLGPCPICKQFLVYERATAYECANVRRFGDAGCSLVLGKEFSGRYIDRLTAQELIDRGASRLLDGFISKAGKMFKGVLNLERGQLRLAAQFPKTDEPRDADAPAVAVTTRAPPQASRSPSQKSKSSRSGTPVAPRHEPPPRRQQTNPIAPSAPWLDPEAASANFDTARGPAVSVHDTDRPESPERRAGATYRDNAILTKCPVHADKTCSIIETRAAFCCETRLRELKEGAPRPFGFMVPKLLCRREIKPAEVRALADKGSTPELKGFISKTGRPFAARLILTPEGGFNFEFAKQSQFPAKKKFRGADSVDSDG